MPSVRNRLGSEMSARNLILKILTLLALTVHITVQTARGLDGRIVGGKNANISDYPYQVSLMRSGSHICGGSIIHYSYVLTAAHCVANQSPLFHTVRVGSTYLTSGTIYNLQAFHVHERYNDTTMLNDIAIIQLKTRITFSKNVLPIALPEQGETVDAGVTSLVTGWGYTTEDGTASYTLQVVEVPVISSTLCQTKYKPYETIYSGMLCAGVVGVGGKDACQGDSGGPLRAKGKLAGITSWGYGCARPEFPGVYTRVSSYRNWIKTITNY